MNCNTSLRLIVGGFLLFLCLFVSMPAHAEVNQAGVNEAVSIYLGDTTDQQAQDDLVKYFLGALEKEKDLPPSIESLSAFALSGITDTDEISLVLEALVTAVMQLQSTFDLSTEELQLETELRFDALYAGAVSVSDEHDLILGILTTEARRLGLNDYLPGWAGEAGIISGVNKAVSNYLVIATDLAQKDLAQDNLAQDNLVDYFVAELEKQKDLPTAIVSFSALALSGITDLNEQSLVREALARAVMQLKSTSDLSAEPPTDRSLEPEPLLDSDDILLPDGSLPSVDAEPASPR